MEIERTTFGTITIDGKTYEHDVIIRLSGEVEKRKKKLSKKYYGTSHVLSKDEAKFVYEKGCEQLILGCGQYGNVHLSPEAEAYFARKGLQRPAAADPQGDQYVQQLACAEDRPFSRDVLSRAAETALGERMSARRGGVQPPKLHYAMVRFPSDSVCQVGQKAKSSQRCSGNLALPSGIEPLSPP